MTGKDEALSQLAESTREVAALTAALNTAKRQQIKWVVAARAADATWAEVGDATGKDRSNAHRDYSQQVKEALSRTQPEETPDED